MRPKSKPKNTIFDARRLIGQRFSDRDVQNDIKHFLFKIINKDDKPVIQVKVKGKEKIFTPEEISAMCLLALMMQVTKEANMKQLQYLIF
ncbi:3010_t:CDS:2 [Ambispora gerdemannii]|uniref:3010_t:CDS:1 n=1 Tax=Ambispora gerdemannii TaxID=144530 RepID=A0A9N8WMS7_9GLOM|nr:3010_t:CDS:2 [Ambispora gerdemannii]